MILPILLHPDPRLYRPSQPIEPESFGAELDAFMDAMLATMLAPRPDGNPQGVGLAAPQVGRNVRCVVMACENHGEPMCGFTRAIKLVNPRIVGAVGQEARSESCLSIPGEDVTAARARQVVVSYQEPLTGAARHLHLEGFEARVIQHEIDHLDGVTLVARMRRGQRFAFERKYGKHCQPTPTAPAAG